MFWALGCNSVNKIDKSIALLELTASCQVLYMHCLIKYGTFPERHFTNRKQKFWKTELLAQGKLNSLIIART